MLRTAIVSFKEVVEKDRLDAAYHVFMKNANRFEDLFKSNSLPEVEAFANAYQAESDRRAALIEIDAKAISGQWAVAVHLPRKPNTEVLDKIETLALDYISIGWYYRGELIRVRKGV